MRYLGDRRQRHAWGYGCGMCPACDLRRNGFTTWLGAGMGVATDSLDTDTDLDGESEFAPFADTNSDPDPRRGR